MTVDLKDDALDKTAEKVTINNCDYFSLPAKFYSGDTNRIKKNMELMIEKSKNIPIPEKYGEFIDEAHYLESIEILFLSTMETKNREIFIKKMILPKIENKRKMLDIGPGDGSMLKTLASEFESISIIDNNEEIINNIAASFSNVEEIINCDFNKLMPGHQKYDLILMSHILYYLNPSVLKNLIVNIYNMLSPNGILLIIYSDGLGKENISSFFGGSLSELEKTICYCEQILNIKSEKYVSVEKFTSKDIVSMQHIVNILLNDAGCTATNNEVLEYIEHFCRDNSHYGIPMYQKFFVFAPKINS